MANNKRRLQTIVKQMAAQLDKNDKIVLVEDGKKTNNTYDYEALVSHDAKSPSDWVNSILFFNKLQGKENVKVSFVLEKNKA